MRRFKEFFYMTEFKAAPKAPGTSGTSKITGSGIQTGGGWDIPQQGYGYQQLLGPDSMTQALQQYSLADKKIIWTVINKLHKAAQSMVQLLTSENPEILERGREEWGAHAIVTGRIEDGGSIENIELAKIMHSGMARGYNLSAAEIDLMIQIGAMRKNRHNPTKWVDIDGAGLWRAANKEAKSQNIKVGLAQLGDTALRQMVNPTKLQATGTAIDGV